MSQENLDFARRSIDAINRRDLDAYLALNFRTRGEALKAVGLGE